MAYRPTWQGHLKLSLVTCPVALYTATESKSGVSFNLINPETNNRVKMITTDAQTGEELQRSNLVKGYEFDRGQYVLLKEEEIKAVRLESTRTINIERFVDASEIDRLYWDSPYFLAPDGKMAQEAFGVIREAMARAGQIALGRVVMSTRERLLALEPRGKGILATTLRTADEVRDPAEVFDPIVVPTSDPAMIAIAEQIIAQQHGPFDPREFVDRYETALRALIAEKQKGQAPAVVTAAVQPSNVIDLMEALKASLGGPAPKERAPRRTAGASEQGAPKPRRGPASTAPRKRGGTR